eukprot:c11441_g1_i1.p1 GENE.c11441_g1_i1~~c11441_g1_i1.p1  ORF type:complete len:728 (-),score=127.45 c11441_g1_i1:61-2244(-)
MVESLIKSERSYDTLPNFTAQDCLRLLGIGRNQYIDLMNKCRGKGWLWNKKSSYIRDELPKKPLPIPIEPWWVTTLAFPASELLSKSSKIELTSEERVLVQQMERRMVEVQSLPAAIVTSLFQLGCIRFIVPIDNTDTVTIPPLQGFVMNRSTDDVFENLLYRVFVSVDGKTTVMQLAELLHEPPDSIRDAVSLYCRLGFARKLFLSANSVEPSGPASSSITISKPSSSPFLLPLTHNISQASTTGPLPASSSSFSHTHTLTPSATTSSVSSVSSTSTLVQSVSLHGVSRIGFVVDRTVAALLMMGNLSPELKPHAVTLYEVGKLAAEDMSSFLPELAKVAEAHRVTSVGGDSSESDNDDMGMSEFYEQVTSLHHTLAFFYSKGLVDVIRFESLQALKPEACQRLLEKNYGVLFSMTPTNEVVPACKASSLPLYGSPSLHFLSPWFRLFMYTTVELGPPTLLYPKGFRILELPSQLSAFPSFRLEQMGGGEVNEVEYARLLVTANNVLLQSAIMIQPSYVSKKPTTVVFPTTVDARKALSETQAEIADRILSKLSLNTSLGCLQLISVPSSSRSSQLLPVSLELGIHIANSTLNHHAILSIAEHHLMDKELIQQHVHSMEHLNTRLAQFVATYSTVGCAVTEQREAPQHSTPPQATNSSSSTAGTPHPRAVSLSNSSPSDILFGEGGVKTGEFQQQPFRLGVSWSLPCVPLFFDGQKLCLLPDPFDI